MTNSGAALAWGTLIYIVLGAIATAVGMRYFEKSTSGTKEERSENAKYVHIFVLPCNFPFRHETHTHITNNRLVAIHVPLATFCLWIMWASCWLHQWHPLIMPTVSTENG